MQRWHGRVSTRLYERARVRVLMGPAYRQLGDDDGAHLEFDAAHDAFESLGAPLDAATVAAIHRADQSRQSQRISQDARSKCSG